LADARKLSRLTIASTIALGLIAGLLSGWWAITGGMGGKSYAGWYGSSVTGSADADPWTRARVAVSGLLALNKSQAIYFTRKTDDEGQPLREECRYLVSGGPLPGRWWSVTVYAADNFLPLNDDDALSFDATEVPLDGQGRWNAVLSAQRRARGAWASTRNAGNFDITLRIYQPEPRAQAEFASIPMPRVTRINCGGKA
jgi:hypothetical protein